MAAQNLAHDEPHGPRQEAAVVAKVLALAVAGVQARRRTDARCITVAIVAAEPVRIGEIDLVELMPPDPLPHLHVIVERVRQHSFQ